jgi:hypothetical protein
VSDDDARNPVDYSLDEIISIASGLKAKAGGGTPGNQADASALASVVGALNVIADPEKQTPPEDSGLTIIPAAEVKPEEVGTLSLRYVDGVAQLVVSGGTIVPAGLTVVDESGNPVAAYAAAPPVASQTRGLDGPGYADIVGFGLDGVVILRA